MADTIENTIRELLESTTTMVRDLLALPHEELGQPSSHVCAQGHDLWALLTNDIDHETIHAAQILEARYEAHATASPMERLVAEWLVARAGFIASFVGMSDEAFNSETAPGGWTYRQVAKHVLDLERHSLKTIASDIETR